MPVQPTYPGVYVQEVSSGVHTITGVSTSVTAFVGTAKRGPINKAVTITSIADFERKFGGLSATSELSFAVRQFFLNGGSQAIIVRVAGSASPATRQLFDATPAHVIDITALDEGSEGNSITLSVNYDTANPASLFNLVVSYTSHDNPSDSATETFPNLSMDSNSPRFVQAVLEGSSLVSAAVVAGLAFTANGTLSSGEILDADVSTLINATHNRFSIVIDGGDPIDVTVPASATTVNALATAIGTSAALSGAGVAVAFAVNGAGTGGALTFTSATAGEHSYVQIFPGLTNDVSVNLKLLISTGATQTDGAAARRPIESPPHGTLTSTAAFASATAPSAGDCKFQLSLDGGPPLLVDFTGVGAWGSAAAAATAIEGFVRGARPGLLAFRDFTCTVSSGNLLLASGTSGTGSSVLVALDGTDTLATTLNLLGPGVAGLDVTLIGGTETAITAANEYASYTGSLSLRTGIYALESADIFNILCLPGITDGAILSECDAYCKSRRAFMIVDAVPTDVSPDKMITTISGTKFPKSDHAAIFYPLIRIANPLNGGQLRPSSPSGTMAGLFARTDVTRGVWKAPAGIEATLAGVQGVTYPLTDRENGLLNPLGVNCLRIFPDAGAVSWGGRTLAGADSLASEWKYIPVRRTALFIEESLYRGLKWVVFEPNDEPLWAQIRLNVGAFMNNLFRQGAFQGEKKTDAYFVKCDNETTTQNDINLGIVNIWVGFAPLKPAEFVILTLQQIAGNIQV